MDEKAIAFSRPEQIAAILSETERLRLQVLLRYSNDGKAVRGAVERADLQGEKGIRIGGISVAGDALLADHEMVKVEFVLLSKKVFFVARVRARAQGKILLGMPEKIIAVERRRNVRFHVPNEITAFVEFCTKKYDPSRMDAPFVPSFLRNGDVIARLAIDDVSLGGVACFTRFGAVSELFKSDEHEVLCKLHMPLMPILTVPVSVRWVKKSTVRMAPGRFEKVREMLGARLSPFGIKASDLEMNEVYFRLGLQFSEVSSELDAALRSFIRSVQTAESV